MKFIDDELWERIRDLEAMNDQLTEIVKQLVETEAESRNKKHIGVLEDRRDALENSSE